MNKVLNEMKKFLEKIKDKITKNIYKNVHIITYNSSIIRFYNFKAYSIQHIYKVFLGVHENGKCQRIHNSGN